MCGSMIEYLPFDKRVPDTQYRDLLLRILTTGEEVPTEHGVSALKVIGHAMRFPLANGFPVVTERDVAREPKNGRRPSLFHQALGELCAFLNGAHTQQDLEQFGCYWWDPWVTAEHCEKFGLPPGVSGRGHTVRHFGDSPLRKARRLTSCGTSSSRSRNGPMPGITSSRRGFRSTC